jgi:hypothetical protein
VAILLREYGGTPDQWIYECPVEKISALVDQYVAKINAENDSAARASSKKGVAVAPQVTEKIKALAAFRDATNAIKQKWSSDNG